MVALLPLGAVLCCCCHCCSAGPPHHSNMADSTDVWEHQRVLQYITANDFKRVTLQFPDDLLCHAHSIARELQQLLQQHGLPTKVTCGSSWYISTSTSCIIHLCATMGCPHPLGHYCCWCAHAGICAGRYIIQPAQYRRGGSSTCEGGLCGKLRGWSGCLAA